MLCNVKCRDDRGTFAVHRTDVTDGIGQFDTQVELFAGIEHPFVKIHPVYLETRVFQYLKPLSTPATEIDCC
ncbi:hypothetical protein D9M69_397850 [compost metagenome]